MTPKKLPATELLNSSEKFKKKRNNCDIKFTELSFILPNKNDWYLLQKEEKFQKMLNKKLNKVTKPAEYEIKCENKGSIYLYFYWSGGRTYSLSELSKIQRNYKNIQIVGPIRLLNVLSEQHHEKTAREDIEMLPIKTIKLESEYQEAKDKLLKISQEVQELLNEAIELKEKKLISIREEEMRENSIAEYEILVAELEEKKLGLLRENEILTKFINDSQLKLAELHEDRISLMKEHKKLRKYARGFDKREEIIVKAERILESKREELEARENIIQKEENRILWAKFLF